MNCGVVHGIADSYLPWYTPRPWFRKPFQSGMPVLSKASLLIFGYRVRSFLHQRLDGSSESYKDSRGLDSLDGTIPITPGEKRVPEVYNRFPEICQRSGGVGKMHKDRGKSS